MRTPRHSQRRRTSWLAGAAVLAVAGLGLTACSAASPAVIETPYQAAAGTNGDLVDPASGSTVHLRDFVLVAGAAGQPGVLLGAVTTDAAQPVTVTLTVLDSKGQPAGTGTVTATVNKLTSVGPEGTSVAVAQSPAAAGAVALLHAGTSSGGTTMSLPIVAATGVFSAYATK
jgi:hypothetical protein